MLTVNLSTTANTDLLSAEDERRLSRIVKRGINAQETLAMHQNGEAHLDEAEVQHLTREIELGQAAKERFALSNLRLVAWVAKNYYSYALTSDDLFQEGFVALYEAVDRFDHTKGKRFSTYAVKCISGRIIKTIRGKERLVRLPEGRLDQLRSIARANDTLEGKLHRRPTPEEIALETGLSAETILSMLSLKSDTLSLQTAVGSEGDTELWELLEDEGCTDPFEAGANMLLCDLINDALQGLPETAREVISLRFGLGGKPQTSLADVAKQTGVSYGEARQIVLDAIALLREAGLEQQFTGYIDA